MDKKHFLDGVVFTRPPSNAPNFVKGKLAINVAKFIEFLKEQRALGHISEKGWLFADLKEGQTKTLYFEVNTWKPTTPKTEEIKQEIREVLKPDNFVSSITPKAKKGLEKYLDYDAHRNNHNKKVENWNAPNDGADFDAVHEELSKHGEIQPEDVPW